MFAPTLLFCSCHLACSDHQQLESRLRLPIYRRHLPSNCQEQRAYHSALTIRGQSEVGDLIDQHLQFLASQISQSLK